MAESIASGQRDLFSPGIYASSPGEYALAAGVDAWPPETVEQWRLRRMKPSAAKGYFAPPGTGPNLEHCRSCAYFHVSHSHGGVYFKCERVRAHWTHGPATDIRATAPACRGWQPRSSDTAEEGATQP